jgi:hypothetical protein
MSIAWCGWRLCTGSSLASRLAGDEHGSAPVSFIDYREMLDQAVGRLPQGITHRSRNPRQ